MRCIQVTYIADRDVNGKDFLCVKELRDWYDFADWVKQTNLRGYMVCILDWRYADASGFD